MSSQTDGPPRRARAEQGTKHRALGGVPIAALLQTDGGIVPDFLEETVAEVVAFLPRFLGALLILLVGWIVGRVVAGLVRRITDATRLDELVLGTPLGRALGGTERAVSRTLGTVGAWFVYVLAILAAADALAIAVLSEWLARAVSYLPAFVAGLLVVVVGFVLADFVGDVIEGTRAATETPYTSWFATGARVFLYFVVLTIGLDTMGVDTEILYIFATAFAGGLAAALALGIGLGAAIAIGWGGHEYVAENIDRWTTGARERTPGPDERDDSGQGQPGS
jgi:hypothetical protein